MKVGNVNIRPIPFNENHLRICLSYGIRKSVVAPLFGLRTGTAHKVARGLDLFYVEPFRGRFTKVHTEFRKFLRALYHDYTYSTKQIAWMFNATQTPLFRISHDDNWKIRDNVEAQSAVVKVTKADVTDMVSMWNSGQSLTSIATAYGLKAKETVGKLIRPFGIDTTQRILFSDHEVKTIIDLYLLDERGVVGIADLMDLDPVVIRRVLKENNIKLRTQQEQNTVIGLGKTPKLETSGFDCAEFKRVIRLLTEYVYKHNCKRINPEQHLRWGAGNDLDHVFSLNDGYDLFVESGRFDLIWLLAHPSNLQLLSSSLNRSKHTESWVELDELYLRVQEYNHAYGCPFGRYSDISPYPIYQWIERQIGVCDGYDKQ